MYKPTGMLYGCSSRLLEILLTCFKGTNVTPLGAKRRFRDGSNERPVKSEPDYHSRGTQQHQITTYYSFIHTMLLRSSLI